MRVYRSPLRVVDLLFQWRNRGESKSRNYHDITFSYRIPGHLNLTAEYPATLHVNSMYSPLKVPMK